MTVSTASSAWPAGPPDHLLDLAEWEALPEDTSARFELVEGVMVVSPRPSYRHQDLVHRLCGQLRDQLPEDLTALPEIDLVVDDGAGRGPATVRVPDIVVVPSTHVADHARGGRGEVVAAIEVVSPGSRRTDRVAKLAEYAEAGIPHYVVVDPDGPISEYVLTDTGGSGGYRPIDTWTGSARLAFGPRISLSP